MIKLCGGSMTGMVCAALLLLATMAIRASAQTAAPQAVTFTALHSFDGTDGAAPSSPLTQATDGSFYGTTYSFGTYGDGTVFKITPSGALTTLHSFDSRDGAFPGGVVQGTDGNFYGVTYIGGINGNDSCVYVSCGTVFKMTPNGVLTTLHNFDYTDGQLPEAALVQGADGDFYGTTSTGGLYDLGTVFRIAPSGTFTTLHNFDGTDGADPFSPLIQSTDGSFYSTTFGGGTYSHGTVFKITPSGALTLLHSFDSTDGANPEAGLVQATDGSFYGTTSYGGTSGNCGTDDHCGTVFEITQGGTLTTLYNFCSHGGYNCTDGALPEGTLVQATDGNFYGTTYKGGANSSSCLIFKYRGCGTVFKITSRGVLTILHSFDYTDGALIYAGLIQGTDGSFYGATGGGGANDVCDNFGCGTLFNISVGLGPFVETQPTSGNVGMTVSILGTDLDGGSKVTFHGVSTEFTVVSSSLITTTVPMGATTGAVKVVTPDGTLSSNVPFQVLH